MSKPKALSAKVGQQVFGLGGEAPGLFELALGFHTWYFNRSKERPL